MQLYLYRNDQQEGPYTEEQLRIMVKSGAVSQTENAWYEGLSEWQPLEKIISFASTRPAFRPPKQSDNQKQVISQKPLNKIIFFVLAASLLLNVVCVLLLFASQNRSRVSSSENLALSEDRPTEKQGKSVLLDAIKTLIIWVYI